MEKRSWQAILVVVCVVVLIFVPNFAQYQLSPISFRIMDEFGMNAVQFSALFSAAMITGMVVSPVAGLLCDKFGARMTIGIGALITLAALVIRVFAQDYLTVFLCMVFAGVTATFLNSNMPKIMGNWFSGKNVGIAVGVGISGSTLSMAVGMSTAMLFSSTRSMFAFTAVVAAVATALWWVGFRESPKDASSSPKRDEPKPPPLLECLKAAVKSRNIWIIGLGLAMNMAAVMSIMTFMPQALVSVRGLDEGAAGAITSIVTIGNLVGSIAIPIIVARFRDSRKALAAASVLAGAGTAFAWQLPDGAVMYAALFLTGCCVSGIMPALLSFVVQLPEIGQKYAGSAGGVAASMQLAGAVIVPTYILTPLFGGNFIAFYAAAGALCLVMAACCLLLPKFGENE